MKTILFLLTIAMGVHVYGQVDPDVENYNYVLGTQTIGPKYGFSSDDRLVETAREILEMGSRILKISLNPASYGLSGSFSEVTGVVRDHPSFKKVVDMPFRDYFFWARSHSNWADGYSENERHTDSVQLYNLTKYLLETYPNTGKTFYIGHWEGDWYLLPNYDRNYVPSDERCQNMAKWYRTRQNAIDKAKEDTPFTGVNVYHYAEINQVVDAFFHNKKRVVNCVLPLTNVDFVSYSSYDAQWYDQSRYNSILDYIQSKLSPKPGITGKRVFIGEVGYSLEKSGWNPYQHEADNRKYFRTALAWGSPFVLYWQMYNNEFDTANNRHRGFWLIDDKNEKQPLYYTYTYFYAAAKQYVARYKLINNSLPNSMEYATWASQYLTSVPTSSIPMHQDNTGVLINIHTDGISIENEASDAVVALYSIDGRLIQQFILQQQEKKEIQLPGGCYILRVVRTMQQHSQPIIL